MFHLCYVMGKVFSFVITLTFHCLKEFVPLTQVVTFLHRNIWSFAINEVVGITPNYRLISNLKILLEDAESVT